MKKILSLSLALILVLSSLSNLSVYAAEPPSEVSPLWISLKDEIQNGDISLLVTRSNYAYTQFTANFRESIVSEGLMQAAGMICDFGYEPDEKKYIEVLTNIIQTYELCNAASISEQAKMDDLKGLKDYAMDVKDAAVDVVGLLSGDSKFEKVLSTAIDGVSAGIDSADAWLEAIYDIDTLMQDYSNYDQFLEVVEKNSSGELESAAHKMRNAFEQILKIKLEQFGQASSSSLDSMSEFFFSDLAVDLLKKNALYNDDECVHIILDETGGLIDKLGIIKDSLELGFIIGKTVGNIVVGGENLINRVLEVKALTDISNAVGIRIPELATDAISSFSDEKTKDVVHLAQMLVSTRIRGEYCMYSILASDAGLLSWANKKSIEEAEQWYEHQSNAIINIEERLKRVITPPKAVSVDFTVEIADDYSYQDLVIVGKDEKGSSLWTIQTDKYDFYDLDIFADIGIANEMYYYFEAGKIVAVSLENGTVVWEYDDSPLSCPTKNGFTFDENGILYFSGYYNPNFIAISPSGESLCVIEEFSDRFWWPYKIELDEQYAFVSMEGSYIEQDAVIKVNLSDFTYDVSKDIGLDIYKAFHDQIVKDNKTQSDFLYWGCYTLYDITNDGIPELIIKCGQSEVGQTIYFYQYTDDGLVLLGTTDGWHSSFSTDLSNNLVVVSIAMPYQQANAIVWNGSKLEINNIYATEDDELVKTWNSIIATSALNDFSMLNSWFGVHPD